MADARSVTYGIKFQTQEAQAGANSLRESLQRVDQSTDNVSEAARSIGATFSKTGADGTRGLDAIGKSAKGVGAEVDKVDKTTVKFGKTFVTAAKGIGGALLHPIQTIKGALTGSLGEAGEKTDELGGKADRAGDSMHGLGAIGARAGESINRAFGSALKAIVGLASIKKIASAIKGFVTEALDQARAAEQVDARLQRLYSDTGAEEWATNYAAKIGAPLNEVKSFIVDNADFFQSLGASKQTAVDLGEQLTTIGDNISSTFKVPVGEAMSALSEGIKGGEDALRKYGISLDDAHLKEAMNRLGLKGTFEKLNEGEQAAVRYQAILDQTNALNGAAQATFENTSTTLFDAETKLNNALATLKDAIVEDGGLKEALIGLKDNLAAKVSEIQDKAVGLASEFSSLVTQNTPTLVNAGAALLENFATPLLNALDVLSQLMSTVTDLFSGTALPIVNGVIDNGSKILQALVPDSETLETALAPLTGALSGLTGEDGFIARIGTAAANIASTIVTPITSLLGSIGPEVGDSANTILNTLVSVFEELGKEGGLIDSLSTAAATIGENIITPGLELVTDIITNLKGPFNEATTFLNHVVTKLTGPIGNTLKSALNFADAILTPAMQALGPMIKEIGDSLEPILDGLCKGLEGLSAWFDKLTGIANGTPEEHEEAARDKNWINQGIAGATADDATKANIYADKSAGAVAKSYAFTNIDKTLSDDDTAIARYMKLNQQLVALVDQEVGKKGFKGLFNKDGIDRKEYEELQAPIYQAIEEAKVGIVAMAAEGKDVDLKQFGIGIKEVTAYADSVGLDLSDLSGDTIATSDELRGLAQVVGNLRQEISGIHPGAWFSGSYNGWEGVDYTGAMNSLPGNAAGTDDFPGGWTRMNEQGGELAYLPGGSAIIPADKTDKVLGMGGSMQNITVSPSVTIEGSADASVVQHITDSIELMVRRVMGEQQTRELERLSLVHALV